MDVRITGTWREDIIKNETVGQYCESTVWLEQAQAIQLPGITASIATTERKGYHEKSKNLNIFFTSSYPL